MTDDKSMYRDRDRINRNEPYEMEYWTRTLGVTKDKLLREIDAVGVMVEDVRGYLGK